MARAQTRATLHPPGRTAHPITVDYTVVAQMTAVACARARRVLVPRRGRGIARLRSLVLLAVVAMLIPGSAIGEQASEPDSPAAGQLDLGANFSCAIVTGGQVRCWGYGAEGELGYPGVTTVGASDTPAAVGPVDLGAGPPGTPFTATEISSGDYHTCVIRNDGSVLCWGYGADGRLGYGNTSNVGASETPGSAGPVNLGAGRTAVAISAGGAHTCAILDNGSVRCWGFGANGQLGYGNPFNVGDSPTNTPDQVGAVDLGLGRTATAISAGSRHTCAILDNGSLLCWGYGRNGRLGYGNANDVGDPATPGSVGPVALGGGHTAVAVSAGGSHTCAILNDHTVRCWGFGFSGQLGYGSQSTLGDTPATTPDLIGPVDLGAGRTATAISAGSAQTCARLDNGSVRCWGAGADGRLGYGNTNNVGDIQTPGSVGPVDLGPGHTAVALSDGARHTCARLDDGSVRCWGNGANGRLGYCNEQNVGDTLTDTPNTAGPVNLLPGDEGTLCPTPLPAPVSVSPPSISGQAISGQTVTEVHGSWSPTPTGYGYQWERCAATGANCAAIAGAITQTYTLTAGDVASTVRVQETASNTSGAGVPALSSPTAPVTAPGVGLSRSDAARARGWRACLAAVTRHAKRERGLTHRGSARQRAQARRRLAHRLASGRRVCLRRYGRTPGQVTGLRALTRGRTRIELDFTAPGIDSNQPPPTRSYIVKQSLRPIRNQRNFADAQSLCHGACRFAVAQVGARIVLVVTGLLPHRTYYYSIAARDNVTNMPGPRSPTITAKTA